MSKRQHVVPVGNQWGVRRERSERLTSIHPTQGDAIERGREIARNQQTELVIHRRNGEIRDSDSYGNDPMPPRDRKY
jgi:Uncharacterized protein conserved in bacteria (DUF2188)